MINAITPPPHLSLRKHLYLHFHHPASPYTHTSFLNHHHHHHHIYSLHLLCYNTPSPPSTISPDPYQIYLSFDSLTPKKQRLDINRYPYELEIPSSLTFISASRSYQHVPVRRLPSGRFRKALTGTEHYIFSPWAKREFGLITYSNASHVHIIPAPLPRYSENSMSWLIFVVHTQPVQTHARAAC